MEVRHPDSGQEMEGVLIRIMDHSVYTVGKLRKAPAVCQKKNYRFVLKVKIPYTLRTHMFHVYS